MLVLSFFTVDVDLMRNILYIFNILIKVLSIQFEGDYFGKDGIAGTQRRFK